MTQPPPAIPPSICAAKRPASCSRLPARAAAASGLPRCWAAIKRDSKAVQNAPSWCDRSRQWSLSPPAGHSTQLCSIASLLPILTAATLARHPIHSECQQTLLLLLAATASQGMTCLSMFAELDCTTRAAAGRKGESSVASTGTREGSEAVQCWGECTETLGSESALVIREQIQGQARN